MNFKNSISDQNVNESSDFGKNSNTTTSVDKYIRLGVFSINNENEVIFHKRIPGNTKADKTKNVALITLYAKNEKILGSEIKNACEKQKCLDSKNFAAIFKRDIENFIIGGTGQKWTLDLSIPGRENAEKLLESMINDAK